MSLLAAALLFRIAIADLEHPVAEVDLTLPAGVKQLCLDRDGAGEHLTGLPHAEDDRDCFLPQGRELHYRLDLTGLSRGRGDMDTVSRLGKPGFIASDTAFLLRPARSPDDTVIEVAFTLPEGADVGAPWTRLPAAAGDKGPRFRTSLGQRRTGSYVAVGRLKALADVPVQGGVFRPVVFQGDRRATDEDLRRWLREAGAEVALFYRGLPAPVVNVILVPLAESKRSGVFGSVLREHWPSAAMLFGGAADPASFHGEWMAFHELFHLGNPRLQGRIPWLTEGVATYYQSVLRARAGVQTEAAMLADLADGWNRFCSPDGEESYLSRLKALMKGHEYMDFYWGSACFAFRLDLAVRTMTAGKRSLDDVLRELRAATADERFDEEDLVAFLDKASGGAAQKLLEATGSLRPPADAATEAASRAILRGH